MYIYLSKEFNANNANYKTYNIKKKKMKRKQKLLATGGCFHQ